MIMMQQAFNEILLNVAQTNGGLIKNEKNNKLTFLDSIENNSSTLTSSILKNNFFSNLVENDYIFDNKENYNLNDGSSSGPFIYNKNSSPISSGLSSLSSSFSSSSPSYLYGGNDMTSSSSLSRSSSTCSLLSSTIKQQEKKTSSSPHSLNNIILDSSAAASSANSSLENILPFNLNISLVQPGAYQLQQCNNIKFQNDVNNNNNNNIYTESNINWSFILNNETKHHFNNNKEEHCQYTKEFYWNINKISELVLANNNNNTKYFNENIQTGNYLPPSNNMTFNFGMNTNNGFNNSNKLTRKIVGNNLSQMNNNPVVNNKFFTNNQVFYQQNNYLNQNKIFQPQHNYNQQLNYCGRANNRGYPQFS